MMWLQLLLSASLIVAGVNSLEDVQAMPIPGQMTEGVVHEESIAGVGLWSFFAVVVSVSLVLDHMATAHYAERKKVVRGAIVSSAAWVGLGVAFALFLAILKDASTGFLFLTGYLVEESLSVDNLVVIALIFRTFHIKAHDQGPVLKWGILGAVVFRLFFVFAGVWLLEHMHSIIYVFGGILLWSAWKMYFDDEDDDDGAHDHTKGDSWMMKCLTFFVPYHAESRSTNFLETVNGKTFATPMLAALVVVELSDVIFAVDSIPCILGLTHDLFIVFSSNVFAILGLRSLYLLLAEALDKVQNLKTGLAAVLAFVGLKMMVGDYFPLPQSFTLPVIIGILGVTVMSSMPGWNPSKLNMKSAQMVLPM